MRSSKKGSEEPNVVKYKDLRALKIVKGQGSLPRGLRFRVDANRNTVRFRIPCQNEDVLELPIAEYVTAALKSDGFKPVD